MRISSLEVNGARCLGARRADGIVNLNALLPLLPRDLGALLRSADCDLRGLAKVARDAPAQSILAPADVKYRPVVSDPGKVLCLGLNFVDHANESAHVKPDYPVVFGRYPTSFVGHDQPLVRPRQSIHFDYEAEVVVVIGRKGRRIPRASALEHVAGYTLMNDGSIRDYQMRTPQWTVGKNFDSSGALGPELVTADELPPGARGLALSGRLNGTVLQHASTDDMIFDVAQTIAVLSEAMTLEPGDLIAMGTPGGVGFVRKPPIFLRAGDVFEVELEGLGVLRNGVVDELDP
jgi:2-keto-4-pentenoate hydratase/2-oxohepta-3-ene-1,7-dioic acid hydratase in catechol pathway